MTELEARKRIAEIVSRWVGGKRGGREHCEILNVYNSHTPLARGYAVNLNDSYCAATVSAAAILAGYDDFIPIECSCNNMIAGAKKMGIWVEDDAYKPDIGDIIMYDWQDSGDGDNRGSADHVGIVTDVRGERFTVTEGNIRGDIGTREWYVNRPQTRGYITPDYAAAARQFSKTEDKMTGKEIYDALNEYTAGLPLPSWAKEEYAEAIAAGITDGSNPMGLIPRYQASLMCLRATKKAVKTIVDALVDGSK